MCVNIIQEEELYYYYGDCEQYDPALDEHFMEPLDALMQQLETTPEEDNAEYGIFFEFEDDFEFMDSIDDRTQGLNRVLFTDEDDDENENELDMTIPGLTIELFP